MTVVNKFNVNKQQVTLDADIIENMSANDVSYDDSFQYDENTVGDKLSELSQQVIYDVTANNDGITFTSLSELLSSENLSTLIPSTVRCGGMSIRFVQSSNNKYVQYRMMTTSFTTDESQWQGVDDEPTADSVNLVKSGGVFDKLNHMNIIIGSSSNQNIEIVDAPVNYTFRASKEDDTKARWVSDPNGECSIVDKYVVDYYHADTLTINKGTMPFVEFAFLKSNTQPIDKELLPFCDNTTLYHIEESGDIKFEIPEDCNAVYIFKKAVGISRKPQSVIIHIYASGLEQLDTDNKDNLIKAINEVNSKSGLNINEINSKIDSNTNSIFGPLKTENVTSAGTYYELAIDGQGKWLSGLQRECVVITLSDTDIPNADTIIVNKGENPFTNIGFLKSTDNIAENNIVDYCNGTDIITIDNPGDNEYTIPTDCVAIYVFMEF